MPKPYTLPTIIDELTTLSISFLRKQSFLKHGYFGQAVITWNTNGMKAASINITLNTQAEGYYIELAYRYFDRPVNYKVRLITVPSNLGKGVVWYFLCPKTEKRCRKLYLSGGYFCHRAGVQGGMYQKQTHSKAFRKTNKMLAICFHGEDIAEQLKQRHFRKQYAGKPTKRFLKLTKQLNERVPQAEIESFYEWLAG